MCGIAGLFHFDGQRPAEDLLRRVGDTIRHRGPDDDGVFLHEGFGMVHRRLSIIDLSTGHQPIFNEDRSVVTILNGELYNYRELRQGLEARGHTFATSSDTEVLVHLFEETRNLDFLARVNGMFAFVIYDARSRTLWLARDRTGKKPLYYYHDGRTFAFASELQALKAMSALQLTICPRAVDAFLRYNYVPSPLSIYREVRKLPPAHLMSVANGGVTTARYWRMPAPSPNTSLTKGAFQEAFREHLDRAVSSRLISDVPLGAFLSGGLDSTAIVSLMCDHAASPVSTFSVGFTDRSFDESREAAAVARALGTDHHAELQQSIHLDDLDTILWHFGEPFGDSSAIPTYYLCKMARKHVTVALSGDGADEVLGGYNRYVAGQFADRWAAFLGPSKPHWPLRWVAALHEGTGYYGDSFTKKLKLLSRFLRRLQHSPLDVMPIVIDDVERLPLYSSSFRDAVVREAVNDPVRDTVEHFAGLGLTERMLWSDVETYLPDDIHVKVDRMSMAHSLEVRCPFLDTGLLEFLATVPKNLKIRGNKTKLLLRDLVAERLPEVAKRRKHGFEAPIAHWIQGPLAGRIDDLFADSCAADFFERSRLRTMLRMHRTQGQDLSKPLWAVFALLRWVKAEQQV